MLNNVCYICGEQDYYYYTSTGNTYTSASISKWNLKRLIKVGDIYVGFGYNLDTTVHAYEARYSTDLTNWTAVTPGVVREVEILSGSTSMVIYNTSSNSIKYSSNLTTWTTPTGLPTYNHIFDSIVFDSKMFLCGDKNLLYVSSDGGATWSNINTLTVRDPNLPNDSAYLDMYVHNNVLYLFHVDVPSKMQVFKINPGSNTLIPVKIDNSQYNKKFKLLIRPLDYIDYQENPQNALKDLLRAINKVKEDIELLKKLRA
jgi:hypothetical protein